VKRMIGGGIVDVGEGGGRGEGVLGDRGLKWRVVCCVCRFRYEVVPTCFLLLYVEDFSNRCRKSVSNGFERRILVA
jgi:hypothetical protein